MRKARGVTGALERGGLMRRGPRIALVASVFVAAALVAGAGAFLSGLEVSGEFLRAPLDRALTAAFGVPTRIEGPLTLRTGRTATVSADALVLVDASGPAGATLARGLRPAARIDLLALLRRVVALDEVTGEQLEFTLIRRADGRANWAPMFAASPDGGAAPVSFGGIERLRIGSVTGSYGREGTAPVRFKITAFDGALPLRGPVTARGSVEVADGSIAFDLRTASLVELAQPGAAFPVQATAEWSGVRAAIDGNVARDGSSFGGQVQATADDASLPLAVLGIAAKQPGRLEIRTRLDVTATEAIARDLVLNLGNSAAAGSASVGWAASRLRVAIDLAGERIDLEPFLAGRSPRQDVTVPEALVELLERAATDSDAQVKLAASELVGLPVRVRELKFDGHSRDLVVGASVAAVASGTHARAGLDYDARKPQRTLTAQVEGGRASTAGLPAAARPRELSGTVASLRGQLRGQGANARAVVASLQGGLEARDLRWTFDRPQGGPSITGRFALVRVAVQATRASSAEVTGTLGDAACTFKLSGGALAPLLEGERWPVQLAGSCPGERFSATGQIALAQPHAVGDLRFEATADRVGPVAAALGVPPALPRPIAARGTLVLDEKLVQVRLAALRFGRTVGSGEVALPLGVDGIPRVQLALTALDLNEIDALGTAGPVPADPLEREMVRKGMRLPDVDFEISAGRVTIADTGLRRFRLSGAIRARTMPPARFGFEWEGVALTGQFGADFSGAAPRLQADVTAQNADLRAWLGRFGRADVGLRAGSLSLNVRAQGETLGALLASAALGVSLERGLVELGQRPAPGLSGRGEFSATIKAAPRQPTTLAARGTMNGAPVDLAVEAPGLPDFARAGAAMPVALRMTLGDARLDAAGKVARDGAGEGRLQLSGGQLDRLGKLLGMQLPAVQPYSASGNVVVSADVIRATDLTVSFGRSSVGGDLSIERGRGGPPLHLAGLRMPALHLEDIGLDRWLRRTGQTKPDEVAKAPGPAAIGIDRGLDLLRAADVDATIDIDNLHGAGERWASGRLRVKLEAGVLRVQLQDVRSASGGGDADLSVDANAAPPKFAVRAQLQDLDYGPLVRAADPGSTAAGKLDIVADLAAQGAPPDLLPTMAGTLDAAIYPRGLHSDGLAFWGTGLLDSIVGQVDPKSLSAVECAVTSLDFKGGVANTTALFVDTARVRIVGQFEVDLKSGGTLSGRINPVSKQPRLFVFAPAMVLGGTIASPSLTVAPEHVVTAPLRFAMPLAGFASDWLSNSEARGDAESCREAFERIRQSRPAMAKPSP